MSDRKLGDHPEDLRTLRNLLARALGLPADSPTLWERAVRRWKVLEYTDYVILAIGLVFLIWLLWMVVHR